MDNETNEESAASAYDQVSNVTVALQQAQRIVEGEKSALARTLHDDLGGLLVGAIMDIGWVSGQVGLPDRAKEKLRRAQGLLKAAVDIKRELIEKLRPTLLDNVGLFSTLRWHMKATCDAADVRYTESMPSAEQILPSDVRIGVFRIFEEALNDVLSSHCAGDVSLKVEIIDDTLHCHLVHQVSAPVSEQDTVGSLPATAMHHRAKQIGGVIRWHKRGAERHMHLKVPTVQ